MARKLPIHSFAGTDFYVDVSAEEFREVARPGNRISFDELLQKGDHYELLFDRDEKTVYKGDLDEAAGDPSVEWVKIPSLFELDPAGMERKAEELLRARGIDLPVKGKADDGYEGGLHL